MLYAAALLRPASVVQRARSRSESSLSVNSGSHKKVYVYMCVCACVFQSVVMFPQAFLAHSVVVKTLRPQWSSTPPVRYQKFCLLCPGLRAVVAGLCELINSSPLVPNTSTARASASEQRPGASKYGFVFPPRADALAFRRRSTTCTHTGFRMRTGSRPLLCVPAGRRTKEKRPEKAFWAGIHALLQL